MSAILAVLDASVLINILYTALKFREILTYMKELQSKENFVLTVPSYIEGKELTKRDQRAMFDEFMREGLLKICDVQESEIYRYQRENILLTLGKGEISMSLCVEKYIQNGGKSVGFINDETAAKRLCEKIPLLHGMWFYVKMRYHDILSEKSYKEIVKVANRDMKLVRSRLLELEQEYLAPFSLEDTYGQWLANYVVERI